GLTVAGPLRGRIVTWRSRGIESIEIVGLLGSRRTSSISLEWGTTAWVGRPLGGGRRSSPTKRRVWGEPGLTGVSTLGATWRWLRLRTSATLPTSIRAAVATAA